METGRLETMLQQAEGRLSLQEMIELLIQVVELRCSIRQPI